MSSNEGNKQNDSQRRIIRTTNFILIYLLKFIINVGLVLGFLFLTLDINSKLFSAITFLCACIFDIWILYTFNERMNSITKIIQGASLLVIILLIAFFIFNLVYNTVYGNIFMNSVHTMINWVVGIVGIFSVSMEIICNIPIDD